MQPVLGSSRCCDVHVAAASPVAGIFTPQSRRLKHEEAARSPGTRHRNRTGAAPLPHHSTADTGGGDAEKAGGGGAEESGGGDAEEAGGAAGGGGGAAAFPGVPERHDVALEPTRGPMGLTPVVAVNAAVVAVNAAIAVVNAAVAAAKSVHFTKIVYTLGWRLVAISIKQHEIVW